MRIDTLAPQLLKERLVHDGLLKPGGVREVRTAMDFWEERGKRAFILMLPRSEEPQSYRGLWPAMALDDARDLLLVCNGHTWDVAGWHLSQAVLAGILQASEASLQQYWAHGLTSVLDLAGRASLGIERSAAAPMEPASSGHGLAIGVVSVAGAAVLLTLGWTIQRRRQRMGEPQRRLQAAVDEAKDRYANVMLDAEELDPEKALLLQEGAMSLGEELERLQQHPGKSQNEKKITLARVQQLSNELAALNSRVLGQRQRGRSG
jgi:hypothetical protein